MRKLPVIICSLADARNVLRQIYKKGFISQLLCSRLALFLIEVSQPYFNNSIIVEE